VKRWIILRPIVSEGSMNFAKNFRNSFDNEELLKKVEKLEAKLESGLSDAVLVRMKTTAIGKEMAAALRSHERAMQKLKPSTDIDIKKLKHEMDDKFGKSFERSIRRLQVSTRKRAK
jgi:predicted  nucleic acid-binding Zn-ribbon protein